MPLLSLLTAAFVALIEQLLQLRYGLAGVIGTLLLTIGLKAKDPDISDFLAAMRAPRGAMRLASFLAGRRRPHLREEWAAVLAGDPESGRSLSAAAQFRYALGFLAAAIRMRLHDLVLPLWIPVDWLLAKESRTNTLIAAVVGGQAVYIVGDGGLESLVTEIWEPCGIFGGALYVLARWLRRARGIELAAARSNGSDQQ
jgi:hypothetical protein